MPQLPQVQLVQAAMGEEDAEDAEIHVLTPETYRALLEAVPQNMRRHLEMDLDYVRNMSCVGREHPTFNLSRKLAWQRYGVDICLKPLRTDVWSYGRLAKALDFCGCEVLLIDAEGHDTKILRSLIWHCRDEEKRGG